MQGLVLSWFYAVLVLTAVIKSLVLVSLLTGQVGFEYNTEIVFAWLTTNFELN